MKGVIVTGGTGGHIFPALAIGREFERNKTEITYLITGNKVQNLKLGNIPVRYFSANSPFQGNIMKRLINGVSLLSLYIKGLFVLSRDTDFVIGTGSYASFSFLLAARTKRIKTYMLEQNSIPGRVTRYFSQKGTLTFISFPESTKHLKGPTKLSGNPLRDEAKIQLNKDEARKRLGVRKEGKLILLMGGSLGAYRLSEKILIISQKFKDYFFVIQAGQHFKKLSSLFGERRDNHLVIAFHEQPGILYSAADYVISRSGAGSIYELSYHKKPTVFVPYPFAKDNHQYYNAQYISDNNAGILLSESEVSYETVKNAILKLQKEGETMGNNLYNLFPHNAEKIIYKEILDDLGKV